MPRSLCVNQRQYLKAGLPARSDLSDPPSTADEISSWIVEKAKRQNSFAPLEIDEVLSRVLGGICIGLAYYVARNVRRQDWRDHTSTCRDDTK